MARRSYQVSGIIQITVYADSAEDAVAQAEARAERMSVGRVIVNLDNISTADRAAVGFDNATILDEEEV